MFSVPMSLRAHHSMSLWMFSYFRTAMVLAHVEWSLGKPPCSKARSKFYAGLTKASLAMPMP